MDKYELDLMYNFIIESLINDNPNKNDKNNIISNSLYTLNFIINSINKNVTKDNLKYLLSELNKTNLVSFKIGDNNINHYLNQINKI